MPTINLGDSDLSIFLQCCGQLPLWMAAFLKGLGCLIFHSLGMQPIDSLYIDGRAEILRTTTHGFGEWTDQLASALEM